ncbi:hypothetical protein RB623_06155 [Mesorhizobium sp. LHD-90]|nr:hypothetical protein [Mesorhizobium sp. LHD-90]MDQ6433632.1 hypothetical protein [Mesorhizobium sp. LHD-90]
MTATNRLRSAKTRPANVEAFGGGLLGISMSLWWLRANWRKA